MIVVTKFRALMGLTRNVLVLCLMTLFGTTALWSWMNFFPLYLIKLGANEAQIGLSYTFAFLLYSVMNMVGGFLTDKFGRKRIIIPCFLMIGLSCFLVSMTVSWLMSVVILILIFAFDGCFAPAVYSMLAESVKEKQRATAYGSLQLFSSSGLVLAPLVGSLAITAFNYTPLFRTASIVLLITGAVGFALLKETLTEKSTETALPKLAFFKSALLLYLLSAGIRRLATALTPQFFIIYANRYLGLAEFEAGIVIVAGSLGALLMSFPAGKIVDKIGSRVSIALSSLTASIAWVAWLFSPHAIVAILLNGVNGGATTLTIVSHNTLVANLTPRKRRGTTIGLFQTICGILSSFGPTIGGRMWTDLDPKSPFIGELLVKVPSIAILYCIKEGHRRTE